MYGYGYVCSEFIHRALSRTLMRTKYVFVRSPQAFQQSSAPAALSTLVTSVIFYSLTRATMMTPWKDETLVCGYIYIYIYIYVFLLSFNSVFSRFRLALQVHCNARCFLFTLT